MASDNDEVEESIERLTSTVQEALNEMKKMSSNQPNNRNITPALGVLRDFFTSEQTPAVPPQIIVNAGDKKTAFGRKTLASMGYQGAVNLFVSQFSTPDVWSHTQHSWFSTSQRPEVLIHATFITYGAVSRGPVLLDGSSWTELIDNVEELNVVFSRKVDE